MDLTSVAVRSTFPIQTSIFFSSAGYLPSVVRALKRDICVQAAVSTTGRMTGVAQ